MEMRSDSIVAEDIKLLIQEAAHCIDAGHLNAAADIYEDLLQKKPKASDLHHTLGLVYLELGWVDRAISHIEQPSI
jgi:thioredoxin-like negative regulator of GroEL